MTGSGTRDPAARAVASVPRITESPFHRDPVGVGVVCVWFSGRVWAVDATQARPAGSLGRSGARSFLLLLPGPPALLHLRGLAGVQRTGSGPHGGPDGPPRHVPAHSACGGGQCFDPRVLQCPSEGPRHPQPCPSSSLFPAGTAAAASTHVSLVQSWRGSRTGLFSSRETLNKGG